MGLQLNGLIQSAMRAHNRLWQQSQAAIVVRLGPGASAEWLLILASAHRNRLCSAGQSFVVVIPAFKAGVAVVATARSEQRAAERAAQRDTRRRRTSRSTQPKRYDH